MLPELKLMREVDGSPFFVRGLPAPDSQTPVNSSALRFNIVSPAQHHYSSKCKINLIQPVLNHHSEPAEKRALKKPELLSQVHEEHNGMDHHFTGLLQLGDNTVQ